MRTVILNGIAVKSSHYEIKEDRTMTNTQFLSVMLKGLRKHYPTILWRFVDATLIPLALFFAGNYLRNVWAGLLLSSAWVCVRALTGLLKNKPVPTIIIAACLSITRVLVALLFMSPKLWAFQGASHTAIVGATLLVSSYKGSSLLTAATRDLFPFLSDMLGVMHATFSRNVGILWGAQQIFLAAVNVFAIRMLPLTTFIYIKPLLGWMLALPTLFLSFWCLKHYSKVAAA